MSIEVTTGRDSAEFAAGKPVGAFRPRESYLRTPDVEIAPHGAKIPSREAVSDEELVATCIRGTSARLRTPEEVVAIAISTAIKAGKPDGFSKEALARYIVSLEAQLAEAQGEAAGLAHDRTAAEAAADTLTRQITEERENFAGWRRAYDRLERQLADVTTDRDALREIIGRKDAKIAELGSLAQRQDAAIETISSRIAQLTAERDASAENARRERDHAVLLAERISGAIWALTSDQNSEAIVDTVWFGPAETLVDYLTVTLADAGTKPRVRVVTSPQFYSEEDRTEAISDLVLTVPQGPINWGSIVDTVAEALGMRRAQS